MLRTKLVCTLGPASASEPIVRDLVAIGLDMARINMSHGTHEEHARAIRHVRQAAKDAGRPVAILVDLAGPKIRVGDLPHPFELEVGSSITIAPQDDAADGEIPSTYPLLAEDLKPGDRVLFDDGLMEMECLETVERRVILRVVRGGILESRKGINLPGISVRAPSLGPRDLADLDFALDQGAEYVGLSFVQRAADVEALKKRVAGRALVVAKIEKVRALQAIEDVLRACDAVMVARGDLGVELPFEQVPLAQKRIIQMANFFGRPVITATQMLESMIDYPRPTRAEASDVANAILDGTDAVMLSGETAVGQFPLQALEAMVRIVREIEGSKVLKQGPRYLVWDEDRIRSGATPREHAVASATVESVRQLRSPAVIVITRSGFSARLVSSYRPPVPIFAVCTDHRTYQQLPPVWGVQPVLGEDSDHTYDALLELGRRTVLESGVGRPGQSIVVTSGYPFHIQGSTNTMRVEQL